MYISTSSQVVLLVRDDPLKTKGLNGETPLVSLNWHLSLGREQLPNG